MPPKSDTLSGTHVAHRMHPDEARGYLNLKAILHCKTSLIWKGHVNTSPLAIEPTCLQASEI